MELLLLLELELLLPTPTPPKFSPLCSPPDCCSFPDLGPDSNRAISSVELIEEICDVIRPPDVDEVVTTVAVDVEDITLIAVPAPMPELLLLLMLFMMP